MKRTGLACLSVAAAAVLLGTSMVAAQRKAVSPDLVKLAEGNGFKVFNRTLSVISDGTKKGVHLNEGPDNGVAYIDGFEFSDGAIEFDVRGKDVQQQSFVGVAFHGVDGATHDAVYLRPFNFKADDPDRRGHCVQYISHPTFTWQKLRTEHPNVYEQGINPPPDPNGWVHVRIVVSSSTVSVFINGAKEPNLTVTPLSHRKKGLVGFWVGNTSGGDFANLTIQPSS
jgi:hypothetical protein